jgi:hypothetical protein
MNLPTMKKREYHRAITVKTADYITYVKCFACGQKIKAKQRYYDGGHGCRAHVDCVRDPFRDEKLTGIVTRGTFRERCVRCGKPATVRVEMKSFILYRCEECQHKTVAG